MTASDSLLTRQVLDGFSMTRVELARLCGVKPAAVGAWLRGSSGLGDAEIPVRHLLGLLDALRAAGVLRPGPALAVPVFSGRRSAADLIAAKAWRPEVHVARLVRQVRPAQPAASPAPASADDKAIFDRIERMGRLLSRD